MSPSQTSATAASRASHARLRRAQNTAAGEARLVERLKTGDQSALETIFELYAGKLYRVAQRILGDTADTEEIIQDVFWTLYRKVDSFKGESRLSTWLYRLTVNAALGRVRRARKKIELEYDEFMPKFQKDGHHSVRPVVDWSDTLDEKYGRAEIHALIGKALDQLKPIDKSVIVLSDLEDLSDKEIADALGLTVSAVKTRLHRARLFMRGVLAAKLGYSAS